MVNVCPVSPIWLRFVPLSSLLFNWSFKKLRTNKYDIFDQGHHYREAFMVWGPNVVPLAPPGEDPPPSLLPPPSCHLVSLLLRGYCLLLSLALLRPCLLVVDAGSEAVGVSNKLPPAPPAWRNGGDSLGDLLAIPAVIQNGELKRVPV